MTFTPQRSSSPKRARLARLVHSPLLRGAFVACAYVISLASPALAQEMGSDDELDSHVPGEPSEKTSTDLDHMYGGVTVAGQGNASEGEESSFGLTRMYGGVTGQAGVTGSRVGGPRRDLPEYHTVKKGDTLWDLSETYYGSPWAWPQVWSLNPQIENPHWIYPGDQVRTSQPTSGQGGTGTSNEDNSAGSGGFVGRSRAVPAETIFVRDQGYIGDPERDVWGEVAGAHEDQLLLSDGNTIYLLMNEDVDLRLGQRLTIFKDIADPPEVEEGRDPSGRIVKVFGTVRIDGWDPDNRIAKGTLIESIDVVERGFKVGPVGRRFDVVPPKVAEADVEARILTGLYSHVYFGVHQLVFIDKGSEDGLVSGNRLRALRRGDTWRRNLKTADHHARMRLELGAPGVPDLEMTPLPGDDEKFPDEVVGELTVLRTEEYTSICMISSTNRGLQEGERVVAVKGY